MKFSDLNDQVMETIFDYIPEEEDYVNFGRCSKHVLHTFINYRKSKHSRIFYTKELTIEDDLEKKNLFDILTSKLLMEADVYNRINWEDYENFHLCFRITDFKGEIKEHRKFYLHLNLSQFMLLTYLIVKG